MKRSLPQITRAPAARFVKWPIVSRAFGPPITVT
jgi:hypothetical protein